MRRDIFSVSKGFTLVELSIVLVIIGLLTGGILAGQSLIRAAELRSVSTEFSRYSAATYAFKDKYMSIPGDMNNATQFWGFSGTAAAGAGCVSNSGITAISASGTCDGNGDGVIDPGAGALVTGEIFQYWRQLALAGLIEGTYNGLAGNNTNVNAIGAVNVPKSKVTNALWSARYRNATTGDCCFFDAPKGNYFEFGAADPTWDNFQAILKPEEIWNIDTKIDDGQPARGKIMARYDRPNCTSAANVSDLNATYLLTNSGTNCTLVVSDPFH